MRGFELQKDRQLRLTWLRRARTGLDGPDQYYDLDDLGAELAAQFDVGWRNPRTLAIIAFGLATVGLDPVASARVLGIDSAELARLVLRRPRLRPDVAATLKAQVEAEIPETPEPGRVVAPQV